MLIEVGQVEAIFRYPVKSMAGQRLESAAVGWHGVEGDRRLAVQRLDDRSGIPWLTASSLPELVRFTPLAVAGGEEIARVRTPEGVEMDLFGEPLAADIGRRYGARVQMTRIKNGIFDDASISVIATDTIKEIGRLAGSSLDARRFRPNILLRLSRPSAFQEDEWLGGVLRFGGDSSGPEISVTMRDIRCSMVNLDPESASPAPEILKAIVRVNDNNAGIYGTVTRTGQIAVGQKVMFQRDEV